jgi:hypothetical protein
MKKHAFGVLLALGVATAGCGTSLPLPLAPVSPVSPVTTESILTIEPTPVVTVTVTTTSSAPPATSAPATTSRAPVRKSPTRQPPQFGYQCRDGDEVKYPVCAGHKEWVDGQREFTDCLAGGGTWDQATQRCVRP